MTLAGAIACCALAIAAANGVAAPAAPPIAEIVARNAAARGGLEAWRRIETMAWTGHVESVNARGHNLSFLLEQRRPVSTRFEILAEGQKSIRVYDGVGGWKLRATPSGRSETQPYSPDELQFAHGAPVIDGPLMDYAAKGGAMSVAGTDAVDGRQAYVIDVKLPSGGLHRVWVDAESFLELRHDCEYRTPAGALSTTSVFFRDYRTFEGLQLPVTIDTGVVFGQAATRLVIERVALNPPLDNGVFTKPSVPVARRPGAAVVDTRAATGAEAPGRAVAR